MMTRPSIYLVSLAVLAGVAATALPASAETQIPADQTCGGLLCDMGVFGHKVAPNADGTAATPAQVAAVEAADPHRLPCNDFLCRTFGGKSAQEMAQAAAPPAPAAEAAPEPAKAHKVRKKKRVAAAEPKKAEAAPAAQ